MIYSLLQYLFSRLYIIECFFSFTAVSHVTRFSLSNICDLEEEIDWYNVTQSLTDGAFDTHITLLSGTIVTLIVGVRHPKIQLMYIKIKVSDMSCHPSLMAAYTLFNCTMANNVGSCAQPRPCVMVAKDTVPVVYNAWPLVTCHFRCSCDVECGFFVLRPSAASSGTSRVHEIYA